MSAGVRAASVGGTVGGTVSALLLLSGCGGVNHATAAVHQPAEVTEVAGLDVKRVTFDDEAARRVSLETAAVRARRTGVEVPYAALVYDSQGGAWVYAVLRPLTFQRAEVVVDRIEDDRVRLVEGPAPGSRVVTVGATEVYGAELGIAGGH
ncbi:MAG: hypothetical protein WB798_06845 [Nocardioidaceae bacterium]